MGYLTELTDRYINGEVSKKMYLKYVEMYENKLHFECTNSSSLKAFELCLGYLLDLGNAEEKIHGHKEKIKRASGLALDGTLHGGSDEGLNRIPEHNPGFATGGVILSDNDVIINQITNF